MHDVVRSSVLIARKIEFGSFKYQNVSAYLGGRLSVLGHLLRTLKRYPLGANSKAYTCFVGGCSFSLKIIQFPVFRGGMKHRGYDEGPS